MGWKPNFFLNHLTFAVDEDFRVEILIPILNSLQLSLFLVIIPQFSIFVYRLDCENRKAQNVFAQNDSGL